MVYTEILKSSLNIGSFQLKLPHDIRNFKTRSDNPREEVFPSGQILFKVDGGIPDFPTVKLGLVNRYNLGTFYTQMRGNYLLTEDEIKFEQTAIAGGRVFNFEYYADTGNTQQVIALTFDSNYPLLKTLTIIIRTYLFQS